MFAQASWDSIGRRPVRFLVSPVPWRALSYLGASWVVGAVVVVTVTSVVAVGVATWETSVGPVFTASLGLVALAGMAFAAAPFERWRLRLIGTPLEAPERSGGVRARLREPARRRELGYALVSLLALWWVDLGIASVALVIPGLLVSAPLQPTAPLWMAAVLPLVGVVLLPVALFLIAAWAGVRATMTRAVLAPREAELIEVVRSRARLVDAFETERRRIERDLHDGAQQRLVALSMKLGLASLDLPPGSPAARQVREAHEMARAALTDLRELIRGVHPQVLTERGLSAAVRDVAGRSPVPVDVDVELAGRLPAAVEVTAYFVVCEALTNVAKHSGAQRCAIRGRVADGLLALEVRDSGAGGADPEAGTGLTGLVDRLAVLDGRMLLSSPMGGPTLLRVEIPCPASK